MLFYRRFYGFAGCPAEWSLTGWFSIGHFAKKVKGAGGSARVLGFF
jgi:hypothetical protein